jgi:hypothetical protein
MGRPWSLVVVVVGESRDRSELRKRNLVEKSPISPSRSIRRKRRKIYFFLVQDVELGSVIVIKSWTSFDLDLGLDLDGGRSSIIIIIRWWWLSKQDEDPLPAE